MWKQKGMTLIELLITSTIIVALTSIAIPSFQRLKMQQQSYQVYSVLVSALNFTRSSAITSKITTTLCPNHNNVECGKDWTNGILIFTDRNQDGKFDVGADEILKITAKPHHPHSLKWSSFGNRPFIRYSPLGHTLNQNGTFVYCPKDGNSLYAQAIIVNRTGRIRRWYDKNKNGVIERANGDDIQC